MKIRGCNILLEDLEQYVLWMNVLPDNQVQVKMKKAIDTFRNEDWYINGVFNNNESAINACCEVIREHHDAKIMKISSIQEVEV